MVLRDPLAQRGARPRVYRRRLQRRAERRGLGVDRAGDAHVGGVEAPCGSSLLGAILASLWHLADSANWIKFRPTGFDFAQLDSIRPTGFDSPIWIRFAQLDSIRP